MIVLDTIGGVFRESFGAAYLVGRLWGYSFVYVGLDIENVRNVGWLKW